MKVRKIISLTALLSFLVLILTGSILFIVPHGRVAYWADWRLLGLSKTQWGDIHINIGILFAGTIFFHVYYNWKPIVSYVKNQSKKYKIITQELTIAILIAVLFCFGTYFEISPFSTILQINKYIKDSGTEKYGEPPYGHAELSPLKIFVARMGLDLTECMKYMKKAGISVESDNQTILEIAVRNKITPKQVYINMNSTGSDAPGDMINLPANPMPGFGRKTLSDICMEYGLDVDMVIKRFAESNITATGDMAIKAIAEQNKKYPVDIYNVLKDFTSSSSQQ